MIIENSTLQMVSTHSHQESSLQEESLRFWIGHSPTLPPSQSQNLPVSPIVLPLDTIEFSEEAQKLAANGTQNCEAEDIPSEDETKIRALQAMLEAFTGKKIRFIIPRLDKLKHREQIDQMKLRALSSSEGPTRAGWGLEYHASKTYSEQEQVSFAAQGIVKTSDGKEINVSLALNMSRSFYSHEEVHVLAGDAAKIDPLVINFNGPATALTTDKFSFDLDADGTAEKISFVQPGSGFLSLDVNGDGVINNGKELFGPQTGNGFAELAQYDTDGNSWIDENDPIWDKLRIWTKDAEGKDVLFALGEKGVGAIYLGSISTEFALKDASNQQHGQLRSSSVFLRENGTAGTVQQIDLIG